MDILSLFPIPDWLRDERSMTILSLYFSTSILYEASHRKFNLECSLQHVAILDLLKQKDLDLTAFPVEELIMLAGVVYEDLQVEATRFDFSHVQFPDEIDSDALQTQFITHFKAIFEHLLLNTPILNVALNLVKNKIKICYLEVELEEMIQIENYEKAAQIRDEITELKK